MWVPAHICWKITSQQSSLTDLEYSQALKLTRRQLFLKILEQVVPWPGLEARIRPFYHLGPILSEHFPHFIEP